MGKQKWIQKESEKWIEQGIADRSTVERIRNFYLDAAPERSWGAFIFGVLGAVLVGLGVIALFAANWDALPKAVRLTVAFTPLTLCVLAYLIGAIRKEKTSRLFYEILGAFWILAIGTGIALVSQVYHLTSNPEGLFLAWTLLSLPVLYATRAWVPHVGYVVLSLIWTCVMQNNWGTGVLFWPVVALAFPHWYALSREKRESYYLNTQSWCILACLLIGLGVSLEKCLPGLWTIIYAGAFASLFLWGTIKREQGNVAAGENAQTIIGGVGLFLLLFLLGMEWPWDEIGYIHYRSEGRYHSGAGIFDYCLTVVLPFLSVFFLCYLYRMKNRLKKDRKIPLAETITWGIAPIVVAGTYSLSSFGERELLAASILQLYFLIAGIVTLIQGIRGNMLYKINTGVAAILLIVLHRFLGDEWSFTVKGCVFIICGCCFFFINHIFSKRIKAKEIAE